MARYDGREYNPRVRHLDLAEGPGAPRQQGIPLRYHQDLALATPPQRGHVQHPINHRMRNRNAILASNLLNMRAARGVLNRIRNDAAADKAFREQKYITTKAKDLFRNKIYKLTKKRNVIRQRAFDRLGPDAQYSGFGKYRKISKHRIVAHPKIRRVPLARRNWGTKKISKKIRSMTKGHSKFDLDIFRQKWHRHRRAMKDASCR